MRKKGKFFLLGFAVVAAAALYIMPRMVQSSIPSVYYVTPNQKTYENLINCTGIVQSADVRAVYVQSTLVASGVHVAVGDRVSAGDLLVTVDQDRTRELDLESLTALRDLSREAFTAATTPSADAIDWAALAASYGLSASITSEAEQYTTELENLLTQAGLLYNAGATEALTVPATEPYLTAPISGIITDVSVQSGVPVSAGKALVTIFDDSNYQVTASVNEADIAMVGIGDSATIRGVGFGGRVYHGEVTKIHPTARKTLSGTTTETVVDVEIVLRNADDKLKPGLTAKVEITGGEDYDLLTVPYEAIRQDENNDEYVYVYKDGKIQKNLVLTGKELTSEVQILSGLKPDSIVVYNPGTITREGMMIHLKGRADVD